MKPVRKKNPILFALMLMSATPSLEAPLPAPYPIEKPVAAAGRAYYSQRIWKYLPFLENLDRSPDRSGKPAPSERILEIHTQGQPDIIGMAKRFEVRAPLGRVVEVAEDYGDYPRIWKDVRRVQVISRDRNQVITRWEREAPAFFLPSIRYRMVTTRGQPRPGRVIFHHQLIDGNLVGSSDAIVLYDAVGPGRTRVSVLNFFTPEVGPFRAIANGRIWRQSVESSFKEDVAFRDRVEHPDWDANRLDREARRELELHPLDSIPSTTFQD